ncbi:MAG: carboxypeptidase regulatory-like domain-containing protein, partial [Candidatus Latescibacteria bacterium]|nr:carboxypeptidase regulatory-like domain-containing protein [Candidatus Latescibacterota bacterium]
MSKRLMFCLGLLGAFVLCTGLSYAGTTGKVSGKVTEVTGDPLPGANVVIVVDGVKRAGITDENGEYFIINIPPGTYDLETVMMGYSKSVHTGVTINVDHTTSVNFQMQEEALQLGEMIVVAERPPVEHDKTESKSIITAAEIEALPIIREMSDFVELQAGVTPDEEQSVRGGDAFETAYIVDGVRVVNNDARAGFTRFEGVNTTSVQELTVLSGGMNAEYGNAGSVVSIVTKDGGQKYTGRGEYRFSPPGQRHWGANVYEAPVHRGKMQWGNSAWENQTAWFPGPDGILGHSNVTGQIEARNSRFANDDIQQKIHERQDYTGVWGGRGEAMLGGPIMNKIGFTVTSSQNRNPSSFPAPNATSLFNNRTNLKLTYRPSGNVKFSYGSLFNHRSSYNRGTIRRVEQGSRKNMSSAGRNIFVPSDYSGAGKARTRDFLNYVSLTHTISSRTFYEVRFSHSRTSEVNTDLPGNTDQPYVESGLGNDSGWFYVGRPVVAYTNSKRDRYQFKIDYSSQMTKGHFVKAGIDVLFYDNWGTSRNKNDFRGQIDQYYSQFNNPGVGITPRQYAVYFQDKMEFEGIVVNVGIRGLRWSPNTEMPQAEHFLTLYKYHDPTKMEGVPTYRPPSIHVVSPRVGVSHPITERSAMHFTFGKFEQIEQFWWIFSHSYRTEEAFFDHNNNGRIDPSEEFNSQDIVDAGQWGWPKIEPLVTTSFEVGADWNFITDYTAGMTAYYKQQVNRRSGGSYRHQSQGLQHQRLANSSGQTNNRDTRGFELSIKKKFNHMTAFTIAYNVQWVE